MRNNLAMNLDKQTIKEWDDLRFYYEYDKELKQWRFLGDKEGLLNLPALIKSYAYSLLNKEVSEHTHIGPYSYLKIMTWQEPTITENYIGGTLNDLLKLSDIITHKLNAAKVGQTFKIMDEYSKKSTSALLFIIMADDFVPSSIEFNT
jgi:hypothetical protein